MKRTVPSFLAGIFCGALVFSGGAVMASGLTASPSSQTIYVDGKKASLTAYSILGSNYVKLRDIGRAVDFGVVYDAATNTVYVESDQPYVEEVKTDGTTNADGSINLPQGDARLVLKEGDVIRCDDGTNYKITDLSHNREYPGPLPTATCDWSQFPTLELPRAEARHLQMDGTDYLFIRNLYETRRMQYTLYNAIGSNEQTWKDGKLVLRSDGSPLARVQLTIPQGTHYQSFWPWRAEQITRDFESCSPGLYQLESWDVYADGVFQYTEYMVAVR